MRWSLLTRAGSPSNIVTSPDLVQRSERPVLDGLLTDHHHRSFAALNQHVAGAPIQRHVNEDLVAPIDHLDASTLLAALKGREFVNDRAPAEPVEIPLQARE